MRARVPQTVADEIKGKTPEEIRIRFNIKNDFTPEEEEEVKRENACARSDEEPLVSSSVCAFLCVCVST